MGGKQADAGECLWLEPEGNVDVCKERVSSCCVFWAQGAGEFLLLCSSFHWTSSDKMVTRRRGGYCMEQNLVFAALLKSFGFDLSTIGARVARPFAFTRWQHNSGNL